jgi:hypothetical protein
MRPNRRQETDGGKRVIQYTGEIVITAAIQPIPNPSRSVLLGDPAAGTTFGCDLDLVGFSEIVNGSRGTATINVVESPEAERLPDTMPLWYGSVIGEVRDLKLQTSTE